MRTISPAACLVGVLLLGISAPRAYASSSVDGAPSAFVASHPDDVYWEGHHGIPGVNARVNAFAVYHDELIVGMGYNSQVAGNAVAPYIAAWNGSTWSALGTGMDQDVFSLAVYNDLLIAGGMFTKAGGQSVNHIAVWNGLLWLPLGVLTGGDVSALVVYDGKLIAAGSFTAYSSSGEPMASIASWDGIGMSHPWSPVGGGIEGGDVHALAVWNGKLIAGGAFTAAGGVPANGIAAWDGTAWSPLGSGATFVSALAVFDNNLIVGGESIGGAASRRIASWNGAAWSSLGSGTSGNIYALTVSNNRLVMGGLFASAGGVTASNIAAWDGATWSAVGPGVNNYVYALLPYGADLIAGGYFTAAGNVVTMNIAGWNGSAWFAPGSGMNADVRALLAYDGRVVAGGDFSSAGYGPARRVAAWDGSSWAALGKGMNDRVCALTQHNGRLFAAGRFTTAGDASASRIASWDGASWNGVGSGMNGEIDALAVFGSDLIAGGTFTTAGGVPANRVARWNGASWSALGTGMNNTVRAFTIHDGKLVAGGSFTTAGGNPAAYLATWNGTSWAVVPGLTGDVYALAVYGGDLIVGGSFAMYWPGAYAVGVVAWDGSAWFPLSHGVGGTVYAFTTFNDQLVAAGAFGAPSWPARRVATWDGSAWTPLGSGTNAAIMAVAPYGERLVAGGSFLIAGERVSGYVAFWRPPVPVPTTIQHVRATAGEDAIRVTWDIASDGDVLGFKIYRREDGATLTTDMTPDGLIFPGERTFTDTRVHGGIKYQYMLGVVLTDRSEILSQPVTAMVPRRRLALDQNQPNPFNPTTTIRFTMPGKAGAILAIYDVRGTHVRTLLDGVIDEGRQQRAWDGSDASGHPVGSGVYFYRLTTGGQTLSKKMILVK